MLCCFALFVCLTLLASFFLPSHLSLKTRIYVDFLLSLVCLPHLSPSTHLNSLSLHRCGGSLTAEDSPGFLDESGSVLLQLLLLEADDHTEQLVLEPLQGHGVVDDGRAPEYGRSVLGVGELGVQVQSATQCQVSGVRCQVSGVRCQVSGIRCQVSGEL